MALSFLEALNRLAHRVAVSEVERNELTHAFTMAHGTDAEKQALTDSSPEAKAAKQAEADFNAKVEAEVKRRSDAATEEARIKAAADAGAAAQTA